MRLLLLNAYPNLYLLHSKIMMQIRCSNEKAVGPILSDAHAIAINLSKCGHEVNMKLIFIKTTHACSSISYSGYHLSAFSNQVSDYQGLRMRACGLYACLRWNHDQSNILNNPLHISILASQDQYFTSFWTQLKFINNP